MGARKPWHSTRSSCTGASAAATRAASPAGAAAAARSSRSSVPSAQSVVCSTSTCAVWWPPSSPPAAAAGPGLGFGAARAELPARATGMGGGSRAAWGSLRRGRADCCRESASCSSWAEERWPLESRRCTCARRLVLCAAFDGCGAAVMRPAMSERTADAGQRWGGGAPTLPQTLGLTRGSSCSQSCRSSSDSGALQSSVSMARSHPHAASAARPWSPQHSAHSARSAAWHSPWEDARPTASTALATCGARSGSGSSGGRSSAERDRCRVAQPRRFPPNQTECRGEELDAPAPPPHPMRTTPKP